MSKRPPKKLLREWYQKLKKSGFEDIEDNSKEVPVPVVWHATYFHHRHVPDSFYAKRDYFVLASQFLHRYEFKNKQEYDIWYHHSMGLSVREIGHQLEVSKDVVHRAILRLRRVMTGDSC